MPERDLLVLSERPLNAETKLELQGGLITPAGRHYVRTHFPIPDAPSSVEIDGATRSVTRLTASDLRALPSRTVVVTLECAGNARRFLEPAVPGEQWELGAVGTAEWSGVPVRELLERAGPPASAVEIVFRGADHGVPKDLGNHIAYERSLSLADARRDDVLVAYAMNGAPIPREHGGPLRLIVAGWYGMASVKWLSRMTFVETPFAGFFQKDRYVVDGKPLREIAPRAVITSPVDGATIVGRHGAATLRVSGYAWSGARQITGVEVAAEPAGLVSEQRRTAWRPALLGPSVAAHAWREFSIQLLAALDGNEAMETVLTARATDGTGNAQPLRPHWNPLGYANNAVRPVRVRVSAR